MPDTSASKVHLMYLLLLADLNNASNFSWGSIVLTSLYRTLTKLTITKTTLVDVCFCFSVGLGTKLNAYLHRFYPYQH